MAGFDTRNALNIAIRALTDSAMKRAAGGWIPPKERERQQKEAMRAEEKQARQVEKDHKEATRAHEKQQKLLSQEFPTHYMPNVGRQVMADGGTPESGDHPHWIPTRLPKIERNRAPNQIVDYETARNAPGGYFAKNMAHIRDYVNVPKTVAQNATDEELSEHFINHIKDNLLDLHDSVPEEIRARSQKWYDGARAITDRLSAQYNLPDHSVAGVLAALSPQMDWFKNVSLAHRVIDIMSNHHDKPFDDQMLFKFGDLTELAKKPEYTGLAQMLHGKSLTDIDNLGLPEKERVAAKALWLRTHDETYGDRRHHLVTPEGDFGEYVTSASGAPKGTGWGSFNEIGKAIKAIELKDDPEAISPLMGMKHKVRNFYNNILAPNSTKGDVTIDTHAVAAGLYRPLSGNSLEVAHNLGTNPPAGMKGAADSATVGLSGTYPIFAEAYRRAAAERNILPRQMQSITWEAVRSLYPDTFKRGKKTQDIDDVWMQHRNGLIDQSQAREMSREIALGKGNQIPPPSWFGAGLFSGAGGPNASSQNTGEQGIVSGLGVSGQQAREIDAGGRDGFAAGPSQEEQVKFADGGVVRDELAVGGNPGDLAGGGFGTGNIGGGSSISSGSMADARAADRASVSGYSADSGGGGGGGRDNYSPIGRSIDGGQDFGFDQADKMSPMGMGIQGGVLLGGVTPSGYGRSQSQESMLQAMGIEGPADTSGLPAALQPGGNIGAALTKEALTPDLNTANSPLASGIESYDQNAINALYDRMREEQQAARDESAMRAITGPVTKEINVPNAGDLYGATNAPLAVNQQPFGMFGQPEFGTTKFGEAPRQSGFPQMQSQTRSLEDVMGTKPQGEYLFSGMDISQRAVPNTYSVDPNSVISQVRKEWPTMTRAMNDQDIQNAILGGLPEGVSYKNGVLTGNINDPSLQATLQKGGVSMQTFKPVTETSATTQWGQPQAGPYRSVSMDGVAPQDFAGMYPVSSQMTPAETAAEISQSVVGFPSMADKPLQVPSQATQQNVRENFNSAFSDARSRGESTFTWTNPLTGKTSLYTTQLARKQGGRVPSMSEPDEWLAEKNESKKPERRAIAKRSVMLSSQKS